MEDRRKGVERRASNRYTINLNIEWEGHRGRFPGMISDISVIGCFVLCSGNVDDGDRIKIFVPLSDGMKVEFGGHVANHVVEIGFGLTFEELSEAQRQLVSSMVENSTSD